MIETKKEEYEKLRRRLEKYAYALEWSYLNSVPEDAIKKWRTKLDRAFAKMLEIDLKQALIDFKKTFTRAKKILKFFTKDEVSKKKTKKRSQLRVF